MSKTLVKGGMIVDGTGKEPFRGHLLIENDRIAAVEDVKFPDAISLVSSEMDRVVDAEGFAVSPGFIDCHSHFDWTLPLVQSSGIPVSSNRAGHYNRDYRKLWIFTSAYQCCY